MKKALVCGAGGFIAGHLVKKLKREGYWVRGVDIKEHDFAPSQADEFYLLDLRKAENCLSALTLPEGTFDEVYQLAADMGGMGFIHSAECEIMRNSALINIHMTHFAWKLGVSRYFFSSSVCVYRDMLFGEPEMTEAEAIPANPDNEYGWEPEGTWTGGREKAPAALCRKVAEIEDGGAIEVWGDGTAIRSYTFVDDMIDGIFMLMHSDLQGAVNIGSPQYVSVDELAETIVEVSGKRCTFKHVEGPVGVKSRNFSNGRIYSIGWKSRYDLKDGISLTYPWVEQQVKQARLTEKG
jgi:GDP-D-mannose 3',5'-epimerase